MDLRKIKKLIELLEDSALLEMEITEGDSTIRLSRTGGAPVAPPTTPALRDVTPPQGGSDAPPADSRTVRETPPPAVQTGSMDTDEAAGIVVNSPMVGTFYNASSPDSSPYVSVGTVVEPGDALCIIEAMKTYNQLEVEVAGTVKAIYKKNGDPVEFGEPLFLIV